jgi:hypothetical protein
MTGPWAREESLSLGQVFEFRLWAALVEQSRGSLHVFLPLADRGIDALVHRLSDGAYIRVQAKARSHMIEGEIHLFVWADGLIDDDALLVSGLVVEGGLGPALLVVPVRDFKRLAEKTSAKGRAVYSMAFGLHPRAGARWLPYLVPTAELGERFGVAAGALRPIEELEALPTWRSDEGFLGESEVVRLLAQRVDLNLFRPFPDLETAELAVLHRQNQQVLGLQIKTTAVDSGHPLGAVMVLASSFRASPTTYFAVLAWNSENSGFCDECLIIPSADLRSVASARESLGHFMFRWHPGSRSQPRLDPYRRRLSSLGSEVEAILLARS